MRFEKRITAAKHHRGKANHEFISQPCTEQKIHQDGATKNIYWTVVTEATMSQFRLNIVSNFGVPLRGCGDRATGNEFRHVIHRACNLRFGRIGRPVLSHILVCLSSKH